MSNTETISFKHYTLFRKAVMSRQTGTLAFITRMGFAGRISLIEGELGENVEEKTLHHFFSQPMQQAHWEESSRHTDRSKQTRATLARLLESSVSWNEAYVTQLRDMLSKLPAVEVSNPAVNFDDYHFEICASLLHRQALASENFRPAAFMADISNPETLQARLKVLLLAYVCGFMQARKKTGAERKTNGASHNVVSRIFQRIKRIGN